MKKYVQKFLVSLLFILLCISPKSWSQVQTEIYEVKGIPSGDLLNVRSGPGSSFDVVARLENGFKGIQKISAPVLNGHDDWVRIRFLSKEGWTRPKFLLQIHNPASQTASVTSSAVEMKPRVVTHSVADEDPDSYPSKLGTTSINPTDNFEHLLSPQPTRRVQAALLGEWRLNSDTDDIPSSIVFSRADELRYNLEVVGSDGKWPRTARAWHADNRGHAFLTVELLPSTTGIKPTYLHFQYRLQDHGLNLIPLAKSEVLRFESWLEDRDWRPLDDNRFPWPGRQPCAERFRATVMQLLDADPLASNHPSGFTFYRKNNAVTDAQATQYYLESLKDANDEYFTMTAYQMHMTEEPTMWRLRRLLEIDESSRAKQVPEKMSAAVKEAIGYNLKVMSLYVASTNQGSQTRKEYERLLPDGFKAIFGDQRASEKVEQGLFLQTLKSAMLQGDWDAFRRDRKNQYNHIENWTLAIDSIPYSSEIAEFKRDPVTTDPGFQFFMDGYQGDEFIFPNHSKTGRDRQRLPYPAPRDCERIGSVGDGPIKIKFGPWRDLTCVGVLFSSIPKSRVIVQLTCTSGHAGIHQATDSDGWTYGANSWASAGLVDPLYQGTSIIKRAPERQMIYLGISHTMFSPWGVEEPAEGYVTIHMEGQDPSSPAKEYEIDASGSIHAR